jgi:mortality factor 4-like protein 1
VTATDCFLLLSGWGEKYQDWRPYHNDNELHKHDEEGKRIADEAKQRMKDAKKQSGKGADKAAAAGASADAGGKGKGKGSKRRLDDEDTLEGDVSVGGGASGEVKLKISGVLKQQLISDWESVTRHHKLVTLPRPVTVKTLLTDFEESKAKQESAHQMTKEIVSGIEQYFEKALGTLLLYRFERPQYKEQVTKIAAEGKSLSSVYGAEHLLRLFVKLPSLLSHSKLDPREAIVLASKLNDFLKFLDKKAQTGQLFQQEYESTDQEYVQKAQAADA